MGPSVEKGQATAEQRGYRGQAADPGALEKIIVRGLSFAVEYRHVGQEQEPSVRKRE